MAEQWVEKELREKKKVECEKEQMGSEEKTKCMKSQSMLSHSHSKIQRICSKKSVQFQQKHMANISNKKSIKEILDLVREAGSAVTVNVQAALHGENYSVDRKVEAQVTVGQNKPESTEQETKLKMKFSVKNPNQQQPYDLYIDATKKVEGAANRWDKDAMMQEDIKAEVNIKAEFGMKNEARQTMEVEMKAERSAEQKAYAKNSEAWRQCDEDMARQHRFSESCREARHMAASLDKVDMELSLPKYISSNPYMYTP